MQHLLGCLRDFDEDTIIDLKKPQELQDFSWLRGDLVDTLDMDDKVDLGLCGS